MFGYATDETEECMPLTVVLAHNLNKKLSDLRRDGTLWWARPDTKTQVTCEYALENGACIPLRVHTVVVSTQHSEKVNIFRKKSRSFSKFPIFRHFQFLSTFMFHRYFRISSTF